VTTQTLKGGPELMAFLETLPEKLARNVLRGALRAAAQEVAPEAKALAIDSQVKEAVGVSTGTRPGLVYSKVRLKGPGSYKGLWLEWGTLPHLISIRDDVRPTTKTRNGSVRWSVKAVNKAVKRGSLEINGKFVGAVVHHPGARPHPFMRPALDAKAEQAIAAAANYIKSRLTAQGLNAPDVSIAEDDDQ
jgi:hypothetical protein